MESIHHKAKVKRGEAEFKRETDPENKKAKKGEVKRMTTKAKTSAPQKSSKKLWSTSQVKALILNLIEYQDDRDAFLAAMKKIKSHARTTEKYVYESGAYSEIQILSKATAIVKQMKSDGVKVNGKSVGMPKKRKAGSVDLISIYESIEGLTRK
jgi:hypothetical protein